MNTIDTDSADLQRQLEKVYVFEIRKFKLVVRVEGIDIKLKYCSLKQ